MLANNFHIIIAFNKTLKRRIRIINGEEITSKERMRAIKYASVCKSFVENDWDPTDEPPNEEETMKLIEKYQPKKAKLIKNEKIKGRELEDQLSPRKTVTLMNSLKKEEILFQYYEILP